MTYFHGGYNSKSSGLEKLSESHHFIGLSNFNSTRGPRTHKRVEKFLLNIVGRDALKIITTDADTNVTTEKFREYIESLSQQPEVKKPFLLVSGGDGTINQAASLAKEYPNLKVAVVGGGRANNLKTDLVARRHRRRPDKIVKNGYPISFHPLELSARLPNGEEEKIRALTVLAFGYPASSLEKIEQARGKWYRKWGLFNIYDPIAVVRGIRRAQSFNVEKDGKTENKYAIAYLNGRYTGVVINAPEVSLVGPPHKVERSDKSLIKMGGLLVKMRLGFSPGENLTEPDNFTITDPVTVTNDGEIRNYPENTTFTVSQSKDVISLIATKDRSKI